MKKLKELLFVVRNLRFFFKYKKMFDVLKSTMESYDVVNMTETGQYMFLRCTERGYEPEYQIILVDKERDKDKKVLDRMITIPIY